MRNARVLIPGLVLVALTACDPPRPAPGSSDLAQLRARFAGAEQVCIGSVMQVRAAFGQNRHGDRLIISTVALHVEESLRGRSTPSLSFDIEGGTVGDLTLEVSDLPRLRPGDRGVFALRQSDSGRWVPNRRGLGVLLATADLDLQRVRRAVRDGQPEEVQR